jgi:uncharacterized membrane protein
MCLVQPQLLLVESSQATEDQIQTSIKKITGDIVRIFKNNNFNNRFIALYMPDTLQYGYQQNYENLSLSGELQVAIAAAGSSAKMKHLVKQEEDPCRQFQLKLKAAVNTKEGGKRWWSCKKQAKVQRRMQAFCSNWSVLKILY